MEAADKVTIVVTSIFSPNKALAALAEGALRNGWEFVIVGDVPSPLDFNLPGADFFSIAQQRDLQFKLIVKCPERHYTRKNIGYLIAMDRGSNIIVETDDDNVPRANFWMPRTRLISGVEIQGNGWANVYQWFTKTKVWPRGFPLELIHQQDSFPQHDRNLSECLIQQGLADENPDVDAVFRMTEKLPVSFEQKPNLILDIGLWCPFNSQNTTWFNEVFELMYLPSYCSFRMTDIWRSFVAQRVLWECGGKLMFHNATVYQERNEHSLIRDFEQEVPGYLNNAKIRTLLADIQLKQGAENIGSNLLLCYEQLIRHKIISDVRELELLSAWLLDIQQIRNGSTHR